MKNVEKMWIPNISSAFTLNMHVQQQYCHGNKLEILKKKDTGCNINMNGCW